MSTHDEKLAATTVDDSRSVTINESAAQSTVEPKGSLEKVPSVTTANPEGDDDDVVYPSGLRLAFITAALTLVVFIVALDNTIIATAIPTITTVFESLNDVGWYGSAYLLTMTSLQPSFGKIYQNFDIKITYLAALLIFEVGSVLCAAATSSEMLIVGRAIAGIGASALFSGALNIVSYTVPLRKRPAYIAALSSMFGIASVVGPLLGGVFTDRVSWRWCFWINLPFGGFTAAVIMFFFQSPQRKRNEITLKEKISQIDILGAILLVGGITCLLLALQWGGVTYPWNDSRIYGLFIGFGLIMIIFIYIQLRRQENATLPPRILKQRTMLVSALFAAFFSMAFFVHAFYLPFYFQAIKGTSAVQSGIRLIPYLCSISVASVIVGTLITVVGVYAPFFWFGAALFTVGCGLIYTLDVNSPSSQWLGYQFVTGLGGGAAVQVPFLAAQVALQTVDIPVGNSIIMFAQSLGGAISISIAQNIFSNQLVTQVARNVPEIDPHLVITAPATSLRTAIPAELLGGVLASYAQALQTTFIPCIAFAAAGFLASLFIERLSVKGKQLVAGGGA